MNKQADYDAMAGEIVKYNKPLKRPQMDTIKQKNWDNNYKRFGVKIMIER